MIITGCSNANDSVNNGSEVTEISTAGGQTATNTDDITYKSLDDPQLLDYVEETVYSDLVRELAEEGYFVENVEAIYVSKEYIEALEYNSQENIYFGYTLSELEKQFKGKKYVFTLGDNGETIVTEFEAYDDTYEKALKNVAIGTGVILICVTVSVATAGTAPAVSVIFAGSALSATGFALSSGAIGGITAGVITGVKTKDFDAALKAAAKTGSEDFKWGAISGALAGGTAAAVALKGATLNGLTMNEAAKIQRESKWPLSFIKNIHSYKEYTIYKNAGLSPKRLPNGKWALTRKIDWKQVDSYGRSNIERVRQGLAPIDKTGTPFDLHHIGQKANSPLAILTYAEHHAKNNYKVLHYAKKGKDVADDVWKKQKQEFWKEMLKLAQESK